MTDKNNGVGGAFAKCVKQFAEVCHSEDGEGHRFVKVDAASLAPNPNSPTINLKELGQWGELATTPSGPTMGDVREAYLASESHHQEVKFHHLLNSHVTHSVIVPTAIVGDWKSRIEQLMAEVSHYGLSMEAVISHPNRSPAILYGKPLAFTDTQKAIEALARAARDPAKIVKVEAKVCSGIRTVVEVEVLTP